MAHPQHYSWLVSPYSAKTRSYLTFKGIEFDDVVPSARTLLTTIRGAVGRSIMPTVKLDDGTWLQDSSVIIDHFEAKHPEPSIIPPGATQRVAALLVELLADEWLPMAALHYRWNVPQNTAFALKEFAASSSRLPGPHRGFFARKMGGQMAGYLPKLGVTETTQPGVEIMTQRLITALQAHFAKHDFLLGSRPCIGDFALFGPLWSHLYRDPGTTPLFDNSPDVVDWMDRLLGPPGADRGTFLPNDEVPETLDPVFEIVFTETWPYVQALLGKIDAYCDENPDATRVPRALGDTSFRIGDRQGTRRLITFTGWMAQRPLDALEGTNGTTETWLKRVGGDAMLEGQLRNRQELDGFSLRLKR